MAWINVNPVISDSFPIFISIISLLIVCWVIKKITKSQPKYLLPPSPLALPIIGHLYLLSSKLPESLQTLAHRYGPLMRIRIGASTFFVVSNATIAKEIFKTHDLDFACRYEPGPSAYNIYQGTGFVTGPYGAYWRFMRKLCATKLFSGAQIDRQNKIREQEVERLLKSLMKSSREGKPCDLGFELAEMANNLTFRMTMNKRFSENESEAKRMRDTIVEIMELATKFGINELFGFLNKIDLFGNGKNLKEALWRYDGLVEEILKGYEENEMNGHDKNEDKEDKDLVDILLETYRDPDAEVKLTRNQIKHFLLEIFAASVDNTSAAIQWAMVQLINHPEVFRKLRDEIMSIVGSNKLVKESDVPKLPYLQAVVKESLRLHPPGPIIHRQCTNDCKINGYDVKAKTKTLINAHAIMRDPAIWKEPNEYIPERFLVNFNQINGRDHQMEMKDQDFGYIPFGGGRRGCSGASVASKVMHATIGALVQCFDWKIKGGEKVDINVGLGFAGTMAVPLICYPIIHFDPILE